MRIAYFDCFAGISGDMTIGALLDLGVDFYFLESELSKLNSTGYKLQCSKVARSGITATKFDVEVTPPSSLRQARSQRSKRHSKSEHHAHRPLGEIRRLIEGSALDARTKDLALEIFGRLGAAEAKIHNVPVEEVEFHEVGAIDSIVDIVGSAICFGRLKIDQVIASPVNLGAGFVECRHGKVPVPAPATAELLHGVPVFSAGPEVELTTPTGAAILSTMATRFARLPQFKIEAVGYGAGTRSFPEFPNALRVFIGEMPDAAEISSESDSRFVNVIEANIDDMNPQIYGYFLEKASATGALDVYVTPVQMKKNRPGQCITVICEPGKTDDLVKLFFAETTTIGLRIQLAQRRLLERSVDFVETRFGKVRVKTARVNGTILNRMPEYEDCRRIAEEQAVPLKEVLAEAAGILSRKS